MLRLMQAQQNIRYVTTIFAQAGRMTDEQVGVYHGCMPRRDDPRGWKEDQRIHLGDLPQGVLATIAAFCPKGLCGVMREQTAINYAQDCLEQESDRHSSTPTDAETSPKEETTANEETTVATLAAS